VSDSTKKKHLDNTAISIVKVTEDGKWFIKKIDYGRWDVREAAVRILMAIRTYKPICVGIEKGSLMRAVMPYLTDLMRKNNIYSHIEAIPTSGRSKVDRITYGLQGLFEHGRIILNKRENWDQFKKELFNFPSPKAHDDLIDATSMCAHLITVIYGEQESIEDFDILDPVCGF
jgi:predicted phage terminase large subunit-like protein